MPAPVRIALPPIGGIHWLGGQNYLGNLVRATLRFVSDRVTPVLFVGSDYAPDMLAELEAAGAEVVRDPFFSAANHTRRLMTSTLIGCDSGALRFYREKAIDCVFESANYHGWRFPLPTLAWVPDFQHRHLPGLFSRKAWWRRELGFRLAFLRGEHVMLSSADAERDFRRFYNGFRTTTHVVPFAVPPPAPISARVVNEVKAAYAIPGNWFYLPNQFWEHKNHGVVIEALAQAVQLCPDIRICCTGPTQDVRNPEYYGRLMARVRQLGLTENFLSLGVVPYPHVGALMQGSIALLNSSMFEGWSTVVEEAKASGTPMILSAIGVHREQAPDAVFFAPQNAGELAAHLVAWWRKSPERSARQGGNGALEAFARRFATAVEQTASSGG